MRTPSFHAVVFDLGGVVFPGPFAAFDAYNDRAGLPAGFVRGLIRTSSEQGAWAALERGELSTDEFHRALEAEAEALGRRVDAAAIMAEVGKGFGPRPEMLRAIEAIRANGLRTAALTNNWASEHTDTTGGLRETGLFDVVVESAVVGLRKPDPRIYELVLGRLEVAPEAAIFLDDLGINLKPARAMGMTTIKVVDHHAAIAELAEHLGFPLG